MSYPDRLHQLIRVEEEKDLGVLFSSTLKFSHHVREIVHKANRLLRLTKRTFNFLEPHILHNLYTALIQPHLDYACVIWNQYQLGDIRTLERIQRNITTACPTLRHLSYRDRLVTLNLPSLMYSQKEKDGQDYDIQDSTGLGWNSFQ